MTLYTFHFSAPGRTAELPRPLEFPGLADALIAANSVGRKLVARQLRNLKKAHGRIDIVDESNAPAARILLTEVARQIS